MCFGSIKQLGSPVWAGDAVKPDKAHAVLKLQVQDDATGRPENGPDVTNINAFYAATVITDGALVG